MFVAKLVDGPMNGQEIELQTLELTVVVKMRIVEPGVASADDDVAYQKGVYIREADPRRSKTPSKSPHIYVWDGWK